MTEVEETGGLSEWGRVREIFFAPRATFRDILRSARWWLPFTLLVLVTVGVTATIDRRVGFAQVVENQVHASPQQEEALDALPPAARAERVGAMARGYRVTSYLSPVLILLFSMLGSLVLLGTFNFGLGARASFGQMLAMWMYASLPRLIGGLLTIVTLLVSDNNAGFDLKYPTGTSLAFFLSDASPAVRSALSYLDLIGVWVLVLLVLGSAVIAKVSVGRAAAVVVGWWLLTLSVSVGLTAAFG